MSRKKYLQDADPFASVQPSAETSFEAFDAELFGVIEKVDANRQAAVPVSIMDIQPDPAQPRRTLPSVIRQEWSGQPADLGDLFLRWQQRVEDERGTPFDLGAYLDAESDIRDADQPEPGPLERILLDLIALAVSIRREGLTNPITVAPVGQRYLIETGERRWLAYHLLYIHTGDERYQHIAARTVEKVNIWRQAAENNARANLNAISRARQFAVLLMALLTEKEGKKYKPIDSFKHEQDYYAQVADGNRHGTPRNTSERLLNAMGLKHVKQIGDYRALLRLPQPVWELADDLQWTEYFIRSLREQARDDEHLIQLAQKAAREQGYSSPTGEVKPPRKPPRPKPNHSEPSAPGSRQYYAEFTRMMRKAGPGKSRANQQALSRIDEFRRWLDEQAAILRRYMDE